MSNIHKHEFTEVGRLEESENGDLIIRLIFGKSLKKVVGNLMDKKLEVGFKALRHNRSNSQNRYLWGVAYICIRAWYKETQGRDISKEAIHAHTLQKVLGYTIRQEDVDGTEVLIVEGKSTSRLNTKEFTDLVDDLQHYWSERGCVIPDPNGNNFLSDHIKDNINT